MMKVYIYNNSNNDNPTYANRYDAGCDVRADFSRVSPDNPIKIYGGGGITFPNEVYSKTMLRLEPGARALIPTGIYTAIPKGYEIQVRPRSGWALKKGIGMCNSIGTIDSGYRSEIGVILINHGLEDVWIEDGERIAQFVLNKVEHIDWEEVNNLKELTEIGTDRGGGFGSSGTK